MVGDVQSLPQADCSSEVTQSTTVPFIKPSSFVAKFLGPAPHFPKRLALLLFIVLTSHTSTHHSSPSHSLFVTTVLLLYGVCLILLFEHFPVGVFHRCT